MGSNLNSLPNHIFLDQLTKDVDAPIKVTVGRKWDINGIQGRYMASNFMLSDEKVYSTFLL
jgi:hypothetical protein